MEIVEQFPALIVTTGVFAGYTILIAGLVRVTRKFCFFISLATIFSHLIMSFFILHHVLTVGTIRYWLGGWRPPWGIEYVVDELNAYVLVIVLFMSLLAVIYSKRSVEKEVEKKKHVTFYTIFQLLVAGCCGMVVTGDVFNMYVLSEVASLTAYALIAIAGGRALRASYNYLLLGSIGICFYLLGVAFLYSVTGTLNMADLRILLPPLYGNKMVQAAFIFVIIGLGIKAAFFPLHTWQPNAYTYAPSVVSVIMSTVVATTFIYALMRIIFSVFTVSFLNAHMHIGIIISWLAVIAMIVGSILAISQNPLKRMLAYSSISQAGYLILGVALFNTYWGLAGASIHLLNHALMKGCLFMAACGFIHKANLWDIRDLAGLGRKMPYTCAAFLIAGLSMIGIPPSVGFVTKLYLIFASLEVKQYGIVFVAFILLNSLLELAYFGRVMEMMYMRKGKGNPDKGEMPLSMLIPALILAFLCLAIGILWLTGIPMPIIDNAVLMMRGVAR